MNAPGGTLIAYATAPGSTASDKTAEIAERLGARVIKDNKRGL